MDGVRIWGALPSGHLVNTFKRCYLARSRQRARGEALLAAVGLLLFVPPGFGQSVPAGSDTSKGASSGDLFRQVIANQKRVDADLNIYERI